MSMDEVKRDLKHLAIKVKALDIALSAPLWPKRELLSQSGQALYDLMLRDAKHYALAVAEERFEDAFKTVFGWSDALTSFMDTTLINSPDTLTRMTNRRLLRVHQHYFEATGVHWPSIQ